MSNSVVVASAGQGVMVTNDQSGRTNLVPGVVLIDPTTGLPYAGGAGGGGSVTVDTSALAKEATQLQVRDELVSIDTKTPALVGGAVPVSGPVTDAQLRAAPVPVNAATRACVGRETIVLAAAGTASLTVPVGAVAAHVQADGATIRIRLDGQAPTATVGTRLDDGVIYPVDTALAGVRLYGVGACNAQVVYFDRA